MCRASHSALRCSASTAAKADCSQARSRICSSVICSGLAAIACTSVDRLLQSCSIRPCSYKRRSGVTRTAAICLSFGAGAHTAHHSAYRLGFARVAYPWHPLHGRRLRIGQRSTRDGADLLLVAERDGALRELPTWMCDEVACAAMTLGPPVVAVPALTELTLVLAGLAAMERSPASS